jgi:monomeric sarcosine oxidase
MTERVDVVVVGAGVMGAATARVLAGRGFGVLMMEQFHVGHVRGSSHGTARYRQLAAYPTIDYLELGLRAGDLWRRCQEDTSVQLLYRTGNTSIGDSDELVRQASALTEHEIECEIVSGAEVSKRWPDLHFPRDEPVLWQPDGEVIAADRALKAFVDGALGAGAQLRERTSVTGLEPHASGVRVRAGDNEVVADTVVVTAGPWAKALAAMVDIDLPVTVTRQSVGYFAIGDFVPPTITDFSGNEPYALWDPVHGLKAAEHRAGPAADPDADGTVDKGSIDRVAEWVAGLFSTGTSGPLHTETCLYTNAPGDKIIIEQRDNVIVASPCSGQGFQFSPAVGERLADLVGGRNI